MLELIVTWAIIGLLIGALLYCAQEAKPPINGYWNVKPDGSYYGPDEPRT